MERYSVVGAPFDDDVIVRPECNRYESCTNPGSAYVFTRDDDNKWTQSQSKLLAPDGDWRDNFGKSVAIDKDTIVVGVAWDDSVPYQYSDMGTAHVFVRNGNSWKHQARLTNPHPYTYFKSAISLMELIIEICFAGSWYLVSLDFYNM